MPVWRRSDKLLARRQGLPQAGGPLPNARPMPPRNPALERLLAGFGQKLRTLVEVHCRPQQGLDPDDIEQEVRIKLWHALERDQNQVLAASYIQRVVVSTVIDALRRAAVRPSEPLPEGPGGIQDWATGEAGPEQRARDDERLATVEAALAALPPRRATAVRLHLAGFTPAESGRVLGLSVDAIRKLVERGLDELKARLAGRDIEDE